MQQLHIQLAIIVPQEDLLLHVGITTCKGILYASVASNRDRKSDVSRACSFLCSSIPTSKSLIACQVYKRDCQLCTPLVTQTPSGRISWGKRAVSRYVLQCADVGFEAGVPIMTLTHPNMAFAKLN